MIAEEVLYCFLWRYGQLYFNEKCPIVGALVSDKKNVDQLQSFSKNIGHFLVCTALSKVVALSFYLQTK